MRLPWGHASEILTAFTKGRTVSVVGSLSFEERCTSVPIFVTDHNIVKVPVRLIEVKDPADSFPDYSGRANHKTREHEAMLDHSDVNFIVNKMDLLATDDDLIQLSDDIVSAVNRDDVVLLDITCLPKRYFCLLLKRLMNSKVTDVIVTYTSVGTLCYPMDFLSQDPMSYDHLPGFAAAPPPAGDTLVVSVGFEALNLRALYEVYQESQLEYRLLMAFPPDGEIIRREWRTLFQIEQNAKKIDRQNIEVVAAYDTEQAFRILENWNKDRSGLAFAPFGPKPHSLAMTLFSIKHQTGMYYSQPKSYNPDYSIGSGITRAYVVKWDGVHCYDRGSW